MTYSSFLFKTKKKGNKEKVFVKLFVLRLRENASKKIV